MVLIGINNFIEQQCTDKSAGILVAARRCAKMSRQHCVWPEHLAIGLMGTKESPHLLRLVVENPDHRDLLQRNLAQMSLTHQSVTDPPPEMDLLTSPSLSVILQEAQRIKVTMGDAFVDPDHLLLALIKDPRISALLMSISISTDDLNTRITALRDPRPIRSKKPAPPYVTLDKYATDLTAMAEEGKLDPVIGRDNEIRRAIRVLCRRNKSNPVLIGEPGVGKTALAEGLAMRIARKDVPASLLGRLYSLDLAALRANLKYKGELEARLTSLLEDVENASSGKKGGVILFIDEIHSLMAATLDLDAANVLKPKLARGKLRIIGATTPTEYGKYIEKDAALERRFAPVIVNEPSVQDTISILRGIREKYEVHHGVRILDASLVQAATLASRYLASRKLPDSAIDLVDECCASVRVGRETAPEILDQLERKKLELEVEIHALEREKDYSSKDRLEVAKRQCANIEDQIHPLRARYEEEKRQSNNLNDLRKILDELKAKADAERQYNLSIASDLHYHTIPELQAQIKNSMDQTAALSRVLTDTVTPEGIAEVVARWTSIPVTRLLSTEKDKLLKLEQIISKSVVGQPEAVKVVASAIRLSRSGLRNENRPIASFLLAGPSGTGKTLLAKTLANVLFDSPNAMFRIDSSEFTEKHTISRLIGPPPGYVGHDEGGQLTDYVKRKPYSVILVDELEKATRELVTIFLQVLDDGRLTDGKGRLIDFRNTIIIFTSNVGSPFLTEMGEGPVPPRIRAQVNLAIQATWPPEFLNRIDSIITYRVLSRANIRKIVDIRLAELQERLRGRKMTLIFSEEAKTHLTAIGYNTAYGARPLNRVIQSLILNPLAVHILENRILEGENIKVDFDEVENKLVIRPNHEGSGDPIDSEFEVEDPTEIDFHTDKLTKSID